MDIENDICKNLLYTRTYVCSALIEEVIRLIAVNLIAVHSSYYL